MRSGITQLLPTGQADVQVTIGSDVYTDRIVSVSTDEQVGGGSYTIILDNADETLSSKAYQGKALSLYWGFVGETGSYQATLRVEKQLMTSVAGKLQLILTCYDEIARLSLYTGSVGGSLWNDPSQSSDAIDAVKLMLPDGTYIPVPVALKTAILAQYDKTPKQIIDAVIATTSEITINLVDNDGYIQNATNKPLVSASDARSAVFQALASTKSYLRPKTGTTQLDIIQPDNHASVYTYNTGTYFLSNVEQKEAVIPNTIVYCGIDSGKNLIFTNLPPDTSHGINAASVALLGTIREYNDYLPAARVQSTTQTQVDNKADIRIAKLQLSTGTGQLVAPMHCSQELFDAITIVDDRYVTPKTITGYVFRIQRNFVANRGIYQITLTLGGVETGYTPSQGAIYNVTRPVTPSLPATDIPILPAYLPVVIDIVFTAVDDDDISWASGTIKAADGTTWSINANTLNLANSNVYYLYYDTVADSHELGNTQTFQNCIGAEKILVGFLKKGATTSDPAMIIIGSQGKDLFIDKLSAITADLGLINAGEIRLGTGTLGSTFTGWRVWLESNIGRIAGYNNNILQWYSDTDGKLYAGAGSVKLDIDGISVIGQLLRLVFGSDSHFIFASATGLWIQAASGLDLHLSPLSGKIIAEQNLEPSGTYNLGENTASWYKLFADRIFAKQRLAIPCGTDMFDPVGAPGAINIGEDCTNRGNHNNGSGVTMLCEEAVANASGLLTSVQVWNVNGDLHDFKVGIFYLVSGTTYRCRSVVTIGTITGGNGSYPVSIPVQAGDKIGCYWTFENATFGISYTYTGAADPNGIRAASGNICIVDAEADFASFNATDAMSLHATSANGEIAPISTRFAWLEGTEFHYFDKDGDERYVEGTLV